jgi:hypothetical protein
LNSRCVREPIFVWCAAVQIDVFFLASVFLNMVAATPNGLEKCPQLVVHDRKLGEV